MAEDDLLVRVGADVSDLRRDLARGAEIGRRFNQDLARAAGASFAPPKVNLGAFTASGVTAGRAFARGMEDATNAARPFEAIAQQATRAGAAIGAAFTVGKIVSMADEFTQLHNRLQTVTGSLTGAAAAYGNLFAIAQATRSDLGATVDLYAKLAQSTRGLGVSQAELQAVTTTLNQSFAVAGTSAQDAARIITQFGQALSKGNLSGDELVTLREGAPQVVRAIQDMAGKSGAEFAKMAEAGQISVDLILRALLKLGPVVGAQFKDLAPTIGGSIQQLTNAVTDYVGQSATASGSSRALAVTLASVAHNFDAVATAGLAAAAVTGARAIGPGAAALLAATRQQVGAIQEQQRALLSTAQARVQETQAAAAAAQADTQRTQQRIANLRRVEAEMVRTAEVQRRTLQDAAIVSATPVTARAPNGQFRSVAATTAALQAQIAATNQAERAATSLLQIDAQQTRIKGLLATETNALAAAEIRRVAAIRAEAAASVANAAVVSRTTLAATGAQLAMRGLSGVVGALGGPVGVGILAVTSFVYWLTQQQSAAEKASAALDDYRNKVSGLRPIQVESDIGDTQRQLDGLRTREAEIRASIAQIKQLAKDATAPLERDRLGFLAERLNAQDLQQVQAQIRTTVAQYGVLRQAQRDYLASTGQTGNTSVALDAEIKQLAQARELGTLRVEQERRIGDLLRRFKKEQADIMSAPEPKDQQAAQRLHARAIELQQQIDALQGRAKSQPISLPVALELGAAEEQLRAFRDRVIGGINDSPAVRLNLAVDAGASNDTVARLVARVRDEYAFVTAEVERQGGALRANVGLLQQQQTLMQALQRAGAAPVRLNLEPVPLRVTVADVITKPALDAVRTVAAQIRAAQINVDLSQMLGDPVALRTAQNGLRAVQAQAVETRRRFAEVVSTFAPEAQATAWAAYEAAIQGAGTAAGDLAANTRDAGQALRAVATGVRGVNQIADAFGSVDDTVRRSIDGVANLVTGIADARALLATLKDAGKSSGIGQLFKSAEGIGSVVGIIGGAIGLLSSLFNRGPSATEVQLKNNNEALERLRSTLGQFRGTFLELGRIQQGAQRLAQSEVVRQLEFIGRFGTNFGDFTRTTLAPEIQRLGLTFADLNRFASDNGIALLDSKGRVSAAALQQVAEAARLVRERALQLDTSFGGVLDVLQARANIFDVTDNPAEQFRQQIAALGKVAPDLANLFAGIDVSTTAGRAAAEAMLRRLFEQVTASNASALALLKDTGFASVDEFIKFLVGADTALDGFTKATADAAAALGNVPQAFKALLDARRFQATAAGPATAVPVVVTAVVPQSPAPTPAPTLPRTTTSGGGTAATAAPGQTVVQHIYQFGPDSGPKIDAAGMTREEIGDAWLAWARAKANATNGALAPLSSAWEPVV